MIFRCYNDNCEGYRNYGGREKNPIKVCEEWRDNPQAFIDWGMSNGYTEGLSIERRDNNGPYAPWNCIWTTPTGQGRNRRTTILDTDKVSAIRNDDRSHAVIAFEYGVDQSHISNIKSGKVWKD
jgi:hypothetical protein